MSRSGALDRIGVLLATVSDPALQGVTRGALGPCRRLVCVLSLGAGHHAGDGDFQ